MLQSIEYKHFRISVLFSLILALLVSLFVFVNGKENAFLVINRLNNPQFDYVFRFWTYLGEGMIWAPLVIYVLIYRRDYFIAILSGIIICTLLTQFMKRVVFPDEFRPIVVLGEKVRTIAHYKINRANSFPSGHTSSAFTLALLTSFIVRGRFWMFFFPLVAFFVGYSRVYLAQHFVNDVCAGMFIGIVSSWLALLIYERFRKEKGEEVLIEEAESIGVENNDKPV